MIADAAIASELPAWIFELRAWVVRDWDWILRAVIEILLLAVGIYYAFTYLQRTRGWPVVVGFLSLLAITLVTELLHLKVINWLLQAVFAFSVLAILILFQPELRRLLARLGNLPVFSTPLEERQCRQCIDAVVTAAGNLSAKRVGALILIEGNVDVHHDLPDAVSIDCLATAEMLETIFFPNNPVHDGGVIIRGDRITRAACIFPLTERQDLQATLGTRHRAAMGVTEESDAIAVVISEETGDISYCHKGTLQRPVTAAQLREFLMAQQMTQQPGEVTMGGTFGNPPRA